MIINFKAQPGNEMKLPRWREILTAEEKKTLRI